MAGLEKRLPLHASLSVTRQSISNRDSLRPALGAAITLIFCGAASMASAYGRHRGFSSANEVSGEAPRPQAGEWEHALRAIRGGRTAADTWRHNNPPTLLGASSIASACGRHRGSSSANEVSGEAPSPQAGEWEHALRAIAGGTGTLQLCPSIIHRVGLRPT